MKPTRSTNQPRSEDFALFMLSILLGASLTLPSLADEVSLQTAPPVVVKTIPAAGSMQVDPALSEIQVTYSKDMQDGSWSWSTWGDDTYPETTGAPKYLPDHRTCVMPVKLEPGKFYATWLNSGKFQNFKDTDGHPAVPYLLTFQTAGGTGASAQAAPGNKTVALAGISNGRAILVPARSYPGWDKLSEDQRLVLDWSERQFRGFFDGRNFESLSEKDRTALETTSLDTLKGPQNREYYMAIGTLGALRCQAAVKPLLAIATDRAEKDCRDRWMAIRALGLIGDKSVVPDLIHLLYHGNLNTRWWAQISLVRLTGANFSNNWKGWGQWWNSGGAQPQFNPQFVAWYSDRDLSDPEKINQVLTQRDQQFLAELRTK